MQHFRLQRQHVQITSIVAVFTTVNVLGMDGPQVKATKSPNPVMELAHGQGRQVS